MSARDESAPALLVVDDNELNLRLLGDVLSTRYAVTLVGSGEAALRAARETPFAGGAVGCV